ncbi:MAG: hypothetical protein A4E51_01835 [Methanosaeta sp. PtaU1.Bin055]|nr:MAG: hypothetical protein A4E51_01835 [Methanosaeta sp. PtaU1.Bin055]
MDGGKRSWQEDGAMSAHLDRDLSHSPYSCWIIPNDAAGTANVGCFGTVPTLERFISKYRIEGEAVDRNGGAIPPASPGGSIEEEPS